MKTMNGQMLIVAALLGSATASCSHSTAATVPTATATVPTVCPVRPKLERIQFSKYLMEVTRDDASLPVSIKVYDEKKNLVPSVVVKYGEVQICVPKRPGDAAAKQVGSGGSKQPVVAERYCEPVSYVSPGTLLKSGAHSTCFGDLGGGYFGYYICN